MKFISFFAGIGGIDLGLERAGHKCVGQIEINPFCQNELEKHWPSVWRHDDITTLKPEDIPEADLWAGGFPCQDISTAGKREGITGSRSGLFYKVTRLVRMVRPSYLLLENVAALLHRGMGEVLGELASLGYDAKWCCFPASALGRCHNRKRVWIIAYPIGSNVEGLDFQESAFIDTEESRRRELARAIDACIPADDYTAMRGNYDGVPRIMDRLQALGNAVVPAVAEYIGSLLNKNHVVDMNNMVGKD